MPPEPLVLAFDTSAARCAAAVVSGDRVLAARDEPMEKGQAERLVPLLAEVLAEAGAEWGDVARIGVGIGPGNFTGVRISVAAARGLALGLNVPAVGVTVFEAQALGLPRPVAVVEDARRGEVYVQVFQADGEAAPMLKDPSELSASLGDVALTGSAAAQTSALTGGRVIGPVMPLAVAIARIAAATPVPAPRPAPMYLRAPDAAVPRAAPPAILT